MNSTFVLDYDILILYLFLLMFKSSEYDKICIAYHLPPLGDKLLNLYYFFSNFASKISLLVWFLVA